MGLRLPYGAFAFTLVGCLTLAAAGDAQNGQAPQNPGAANGDTQTSGSEPPVAAGTQTGAAAPAGPIGASPQTMPAKFSDEVAARDFVPIMARPLPLTDEQKREIIESVMKDNSVPVAHADAKPADFLPSAVEINQLPDGLEDRIAAVRGYKYVKLKDKVLLVSPPNRIVVGDIQK